jgi:uncharacterized membrane protein
LRIGYLVSAGGILGVACILFAGWNSDRTGDRLRDACAYEIVVAVGLLLIGFSLTPALVIAGYLLFAATYFTAGVLVVSASLPWGVPRSTRCGKLARFSRPMP